MARPQSFLLGSDEKTYCDFLPPMMHLDYFTEERPDRKAVRNSIKAEEAAKEAARLAKEKAEAAAKAEEERKKRQSQLEKQRAERVKQQEEERVKKEAEKKFKEEQNRFQQKVRAKKDLMQWLSNGQYKEAVGKANGVMDPNEPKMSKGCCGAKKVFPLNDAIQQQNLTMVKLLLAYGANPAVSDSLPLARKLNKKGAQNEIIKELEAHTPGKKYSLYLEPDAQPPVASKPEPVAAPVDAPVAAPVAVEPVASPAAVPVAAPVAEPVAAPVAAEPVAAEPVAAPAAKPVAAPVAEPVAAEPVVASPAAAAQSPAASVKSQGAQPADASSDRPAADTTAAVDLS